MRRNQAAFTLIELLVVIAIIGALMALLFPAIRAVQETARGTVCRNNLAEMGKAFKSHLANHKFYPTGGWGFYWAGDPDRGFGVKQPSGWMYNILPFIGESELHDLGKGMPDKQKRALGATRAGKVIPLFCCPSRRRADQYKYQVGDYRNIDRPTVTARNDYAGSSGEFNPTNPPGSTQRYFMGSPGPASLAAGDAMSPGQWITIASNVTDPNNPKITLPPNGVTYLHSMVSQLDDGDTCTYLAGEKHVNSKYYAADDGDNNQGWDIGYDWDVNRWTTQPPHEDSPDTGDIYWRVFGSAHSSGANMVFGDGHVVAISYDVDPEIHRQLGNRKDGSATDLSKLE